MNTNTRITDLNAAYPVLVDDTNSRYSFGVLKGYEVTEYYPTISEVISINDAEEALVCGIEGFEFAKDVVAFGVVKSDDNIFRETIYIGLYE